MTNIESGASYDVQTTKCNITDEIWRKNIKIFTGFSFLYLYTFIYLNALTTIGVVYVGS